MAGQGSAYGRNQRPVHLLLLRGGWQHLHRDRSVDSQQKPSAGCRAPFVQGVRPHEMLCRGGTRDVAWRRGWVRGIGVACTVSLSTDLLSHRPPRTLSALHRPTVFTSDFACLASPRKQQLLPLVCLSCASRVPLVCIWSASGLHLACIPWSLASCTHRQLLLPSVLRTIQGSTRSFRFELHVGHDDDDPFWSSSESRASAEALAAAQSRGFPLQLKVNSFSGMCAATRIFAHASLTPRSNLARQLVGGTWLVIVGEVVGGRWQGGVREVEGGRDVGGTWEGRRRGGREAGERCEGGARVVVGG